MKTGTTTEEGKAAMCVPCAALVEDLWVNAGAGTRR